MIGVCRSKELKFGKATSGTSEMEPKHAFQAAEHRNRESAIGPGYTTNVRNERFEFGFADAPGNGDAGVFDREGFHELHSVRRAA